MTKRMQVLLEDAEYRRIQRIAKRRHMTLAEWVRQTLRAACREEPDGDPGKKLAVVREAATHAYPTGDIGQMLDEIEAGYGRDLPE
ncbi:MAG TPA: antitoxin [Alphaproteobacteria bacterium]|nr:antitoxin [Alphaproteobacteria bacterium]